MNQEDIQAILCEGRKHPPHEHIGKPLPGLLAVCRSWLAQRKEIEQLHEEMKATIRELEYIIRDDADPVVTARALVDNLNDALHGQEDGEE